MSHACPTPAVYDPNSSTLPQTSLAFKVEDGKLIEMCGDCGAVAKRTFKDVYEAHHLLLQGAITKDDYRKYLESGESNW